MQIIRTDTPINLTIPSRKPTTGQVILTGMQFDGISSYLDLGIVPMLNSIDSYIKLTYQATNWMFNIPFGYNDTSPDIFQIYRSGAGDEFRLQQSPTSLMPPEYPNTDSYQEFLVRGNTVSTLDVLVGGNVIPGMENKSYVPIGYSGDSFFLGARNNFGTADEFTTVTFTEAEFFNGVELKTFNAANGWNGATNFGGIEVYSIDGGDTWSETYPTQEEIDTINVFDINIVTQNEQLRSKFTENVVATYSDGQLTFDMAFTPVESYPYFSVVCNNDNTVELLKFKSYCTDQTDLQNYTTSEGLYKTPTQSNNDFIVID